MPADDVVVGANAFVIRELDLSDENNNLASANIQDVAASRGWQRGTPLDFSAHFSAGEYIAKYYSGRRVWRAYTLRAAARALRAALQLTTRAPPRDRFCVLQSLRVTLM